MAKAWQGRPRLGKEVLVNSLATRLLLNPEKILPRRGAARRSGWLGRRRPAVCLFGQQKKNGLFGRRPTVCLFGQQKKNGLFGRRPTVLYTATALGWALGRLPSRPATLLLSGGGSSG
jgi:hypothetical protein